MSIENIVTEDNAPVNFHLTCDAISDDTEQCSYARVQNARFDCSERYTNFSQRGATPEPGRALCLLLCSLEMVKLSVRATRVVDWPTKGDCPEIRSPHRSPPWMTQGSNVV